MPIKALGRTSWLALAAMAACPAPALAQHTEENAVESAEDAFGTATGHEQIGIYDEGNVRGFSPGNAGNFRMEGMYFDIQGGLGNRVIAGEMIRVGPAAQGYAFPAPTGIVDLELKKPGKKRTVTPFVSWDSFGSKGLELDFDLPLNGETLGVAGGVGLSDNHYGNGGGSKALTAGLVTRWKPSAGVELLAFANHQEFHDENSFSIYIPTGNFLPEKIDRNLYPGPSWTKNNSHSNTFGLVGHANMGDWTLRAGLFRSSYGQDKGFANLVLIAPDMNAERQVYAFPGSGSASWSGEGRISRRIGDGPRQHLITVALRGRSIDGNYGGGDLASLGFAPLNTVIDVPEPVFTFHPQVGDHTRQVTGGASYSLKWKGIGEFTAGVTRTHYEKRVGVPGLPEAQGSSNVTLPYFSAAATLTPNFTIYGSYMRGLEDAGTAPGYASNAHQVLPAIRTRQYDFGLRWSPVKDTTLILGWFNISKPYIDLDTTNYYGVLGSETHKGVELSITSNPTKHLRVVLGGVWQDPKVTASPLIATPVGARPVGQSQLRTRFNVNWTLPFAPAVTLDAYVNHDSEMQGNVENSVLVPGSTRFGGGVRYKFKLGGHDMTARVALYNVNDTYMFVPVGSGAYSYNIRRNVQAWITADF